MSERDERSGRETRLLALVIVVALAALLLLARFRFPAADLSATPAQGPLERLAARSTYEDLAASVAGLVQRVSTSVVVLRIQTKVVPEKPAEPGRRTPVPEPPPPVSRLVPGLRVARDLALVYVPAGFEVTAGQGLAAPLEALQTDPDREMTLVRAPSVLEITSVLANPLDGYSGFSYVGVVEAAIGGLTAKPMFIGRVDVSTDPRWPGPVLVIGGTINLPPGAVVCGLDGRFIGLVVPFDDDRRAILPGNVLRAMADTLEAAPPAPPPVDDKSKGAGGRGRGVPQ